jgi:hypothetical protein
MHAKRLQERGLSFRYFYKFKPEIFNADRIVINQKFARNFWREKKEEMLEFLTKAKKECEKVFWFDITDSTALHEPDVLPYVDGYFKAQIFRDLSNYIKPFYSNRIFSDYYYRQFGIIDDNAPSPTCLKSDEHTNKIFLFWNLALSGLFGMGPRIYHILQEILPLPYRYCVKFVSPERNRPLDISCHINIHYGRETISFQRKIITELLKENFGMDVSSIPRHQYYRELKQSKIAPSPFGWGESSFRDFEVISYGAALMKPDLEHLKTWPELYIKDKTYISFRWDTSDFIENIEYHLDNKRYVEIAKTAQNLYHRYLYSREGQDEFIERVLRIFRDNGIQEREGKRKNQTGKPSLRN